MGTPNVRIVRRSVRRRTNMAIALCAGLALLLPFAACSGGNGSAGSGTPQQTGQSCSQASQCFPGLEAGVLRGEATCLTQLQGGYCTHTCQTDADCCAVPGECANGIKEVCASFESTARMYCFLSCAPSDVLPASDGGVDPSAFCQQWANPTFTCRSTGGGSANRKFCGP
jgi:hypothetical protein